MVRGEEHIVFPSEFPPHSEVYDILLSAVRDSIATNVMRPVHVLLEPILGDAKKVFDHSIMYRNVGMIGAVDLFTGSGAVQQVLGRILYDDTVMSRFVNDSNNCLVNEAAMEWTSVRKRSQNILQVEHIMPRNPVAERYLRRIGLVARDTDDEDIVKIVWEVPYSDEDMSGIVYIASNLESILTIYYKLLTRFPTCRSYLNDLPGFENS